MKKMEEMNAYMSEVHRDYIHKSAMSEMSAKEVIFNS